MWAASEMIQESIMPKKAPGDVLESFGRAQRSRPEQRRFRKKTRAGQGRSAFLLRRPRAGGAHPVRASEKSMWDEM